jgi:hypothetical protein
MVKICIDAGHGGSDSGASYNGHLEKVLNLMYAKKIHDILKPYNCNLLLTRQDDSTISIEKRGEWMKEFDPELCVSCHFNAGGGAGTEGIISVNAPAYITTLATMCIASTIINQFKLEKKGGGGMSEQPKKEIPQWKKDESKWLYENGYTDRFHDPLELIDIGTLGAILHNKEEFIMQKLKKQLGL